MRKELDRLKEIVDNKEELTEHVEQDITRCLDEIEDTLVENTGDVPDIFVSVDQLFFHILENGWTEDDLFATDLGDNLEELENEIFD
jgi:hypothetical protein